ncbi:TonB-dependent receptor [Indioceanicola profundi]|uniref:TonB-dependent receptor n=1 Tax=Indioceanicola profundi TaxID=2220096 RepID=UPI000E6AB49F|nr:TonB-dependent receptor [Indioceanicola profundi]
MKVGSERMKGLLRASCGAFAMIAGAAAPALAQNAPALEEIIVTAQKRQENQQQVPVSVATVSGERLSNYATGGQDIRFLSARVPSLTAESSFGRTFPRFYIRGLGNTDFDLNASQPVSLVYDEVVLENPILKGLPVFDVERVEVLRGPQGTLFGRNTPAGIISLVSKKPTEETEGYASVSYGRFNSIDMEAAVGGAIVENKVSARISFLHQRRDDWVDNTFTGVEDDLEGYDDTAGRAQVLFTPNDRLSILANGHFRSANGTARVFRANIIEQGTNNLRDNFDIDKVALDGENVQEVNQRGASLKVSYDLDAVTLTSITAYEHGDVFSRGDVDGGVANFQFDGGQDSIPFPVESASKVPGVTQWSEEFRVSSNGSGPLRWQAGVYYFNDDLDFQNINYGNAAQPLGWASVATSNQENEAWAVFGQASYDITEALTVTGGLRYTDDKRELTKFTTNYSAVDGSVASVVTDPLVEVSDDRITWDVALDYAVTDDVLLFTRVANGFRAPSIQPRSLAGTPSTTAGAEKIQSYEVGVKSDLFQNRARVNLTAFYYEVKDQQFTAVGGIGNANTLLNAEKGVGKGFEAELELIPVENLFLTAGLSYNDTEIKDDDLFVAFCRSCTVTDPLVTRDGSTLASIDGNPFPHAPKWIFSTTARYGIQLGGGELYAFTDWSYKDNANFFLYESVEFQNDSYWLGGLRVGYAFDRFDISAYVRNITDEEQLEGGIDFNNLTGFVIEPRTYGVTARVTF